MPSPENRDSAEPGRYCRRCAADLAGVDGGHCPACGKWFNPDDSMTYASWPFDPDAYRRSQRRMTILQAAFWIGVALLAIALAVFFAWASMA